MVGTVLTASFGGCASVLEAANSDDISSDPETQQTASGTEADPDAQATSADSDDEPFDSDAVEIDWPSVSFASDPPMPDDPDRDEYATVGSADVTATVYRRYEANATGSYGNLRFP
jgi:hypothetical protein